MSPLFFLTVSLLWAHELDAVHRKEWKILPGLRSLGEHQAFIVFTLLHVPLMMATLRWFDAPTFQRGIDLFAIVHIGLHALLHDHPSYDFDSGFSRSLIWGAGAAGALHLVSLLALPA
ncbi:MAG: DUF6713 family protein [Acidobacteriota bacterium]